jgi:hypothetical protein
MQLFIVNRHLCQRSPGVSRGASDQSLRNSVGERPVEKVRMPLCCPARWTSHACPKANRRLWVKSSFWTCADTAPVRWSWGAGKDPNGKQKSLMPAAALQLRHHILSPGFMLRAGCTTEPLNGSCGTRKAGNACRLQAETSIRSFRILSSSRAAAPL